MQAEWSYPALKTSPCRYAGTPEEGLVIAAHNYEQHFARLSLLTAGFTASFEFGGKMWNSAGTAPFPRCFPGTG